MDILKAKARLIANTRHKGARRLDNLYDVANLISLLRTHYNGSLKKVSEEVVDISPDMLNRFLSALKVDKRIIPLIKNRKIDNINVLFYIQTLNGDDQFFLANLVAEGKINSADVRAITPLKKKHPNKPIKEIAELVSNSKDKKRYIVKFDITESTNIKLIQKTLGDIISRAEFEIENKNKFGTIIFTKFGYESIKKYCKEHEIVYEKLIKSIINN